jgi:hypothetical protein
MLLDDLGVFLRANLVQPHLRKLWRTDIGTQINFVQAEKRFRIPKGGASREPYYHDTPYHPALNPESVLGVGVNGWNWVDQISEFVTFDLDSVVNHTEGLAPEALAGIVERLKTIPEVEIVRSKSGHGYHARVYFDPHPAAGSHTDHAHNARRVLAWMSKQIEMPLAGAVDCYGAIAWIWHQKTAPNGFELIKGAT